MYYTIKKHKESGDKINKESGDKYSPTKINEVYLKENQLHLRKWNCSLINHRRSNHLRKSSVLKQGLIFNHQEI